MFSPPVCNKLMHKRQLTVMFVGGPNRREDFHLEEGSEFFWQMRGNMVLPTIQQGKLKHVHINEGQVFLLPSRVPHSPQRPEKDSLGLVIERERYNDDRFGKVELDGLRWYTDFEKCTDVLWEKYFHCGDLGRDLVPVIQEYKNSQEFATRVPTGDHVIADPPLSQDTSTSVPDPFNLQLWIDEHADELASGRSINLFEGHPDREFSVRIVGGRSSQSDEFEYETWLYQIKGEATVRTIDGDTVLLEGDCCIVKPASKYSVERTDGSIGMTVTQDPRGNKRSLRKRSLS